jgi:hypothetical protein
MQLPRASNRDRGNFGRHSTIRTATTGAAADTQAPSTPTGLNATPVSSTQIILSWSASNDTVGVTNHLIERCPETGRAREPARRAGSL